MKNLNQFVKFFSMLLCFYIVSSCTNEYTLSSVEKNLNLVSPNGIKIANSIEDLRAHTAKVIIDITGAAAEFSISEIVYMPVKVGYSANVKFITNQGQVGNYILHYGSEYQLKSNSIVSMDKSGKISTLQGGGAISPLQVQQTMTCHRLGDCPCLIQVVITSNGTCAYGCGDCEQCSMSIVTN